MRKQLLTLALLAAISTTAQQAYRLFVHDTEIQIIALGIQLGIKGII